jgi:hypothetical protein
MHENSDFATKINEINVELSENSQRYVNECCESESDGKIDGFDAGCCKCRGGVAVAVWCSDTPPCEMPPKPRQLRAPRTKASGNAFQALVDPPNDGHTLSFHGGDGITDGSDDNTVVVVNPCDSGPPSPLQLQKDVETLEHLGCTATALETFQTAILRLAETNDRHDVYMHELNRKLVAISEGETHAYDDDTTRTDDRFVAIESKMDILLQKMDATWTENTALSEAYRASREETVALKAAVDTLTKKLDETIAISAPPSPDTATSPTAMEEMTMQLMHVQHDIQDVLDAIRNPPGKRKGRTSDQDNEPTTLTNRRPSTQRHREASPEHSLIHSRHPTSATQQALDLI